MLLILACGCATRHDLGEVPVEGGTASQRDAVLQELDVFAEWIGPGRIELSRIEVTSTASHLDDASGFYYGPTARIQVSADLSPSEIRETLRHELCHAVDFQGNLLDGPQPVFDTLATSIDGDEDHALHDAVVGRSNRTMRAELLAYVCQQAPLGTALLAKPCPDESSEYSEVAEWINDHIWTGNPDVSPVASHVQSSSVVEWGSPAGVSTLVILGSENEDAAFIVALSSDPLVSEAYVSPIDGTAVAQFADPTLESIEAGYSISAPVGAPEIGVFDSISVDDIHAVSEGGTTLRLVEGLWKADLGGLFAPHLIAESGDGWSVVEDACPSRVNSVFAADGQLYLGWADASRVLMVPIE